MARNIDGDYKHFIDVASGRLRKSLRKYIKTGKIYPLRANGGNIAIPIPEIETPYFVHGENDTGTGRGAGEDGKVIGNTPGQKGSGGGNEASEGMLVNVDLEEVLMFMQDELKLPDLQPKPNEIFEDVERKYNDIARTGSESLRHNRRTMREALKRSASSGNVDKLYYIPGQKDPVKLILPINSDKRYRTYKEIKKPSSNAVIFFARDGSGSVGTEHCEIINDMCWWIDVWIRRFYEKVERCYFWHDSLSKEVDEETFYKLRGGGGTIISSVFTQMSEQFKDRFPLDRWNIYVFYFTDGENWEGDNPKVLETIKEKFGPAAVNLMAITQVLVSDYSSSFKKFIDNTLEAANIRTTSIGPESSDGTPLLSDEERGDSIKNAIKVLLGNKPTYDMSF